MKDSRADPFFSGPLLGPLLSLPGRSNVGSRGGRFGPGQLGDSMRDIVQYIQPADTLFLQEIGSVRILLAHQGRKEITDVGLFLPRRLDVHDGPLEDPLQGRGGLRAGEGCILHFVYVGLEERLNPDLEVVEVPSAGADYARALVVVYQRVQEVFQ